MEDASRLQLRGEGNEAHGQVRGGGKPSLWSSAVGAYGRSKVTIEEMPAGSRKNCARVKRVVNVIQERTAQTRTVTRAGKNNARPGLRVRTASFRQSVVQDENR